MKENGYQYIAIKVLKDLSNKECCPRISDTRMLSFSIERTPDPLGYPEPDSFFEKNPFREFPCENCEKQERKGKFNETEGSYNEFRCTTYKGKVIELGVP